MPKRPASSAWVRKRAGQADSHPLVFDANLRANFKNIFSQFSRPLPDHCQSESLRLCLNWLHFPSTDSIGFQAVSALANLLELHRNHCGWWFGLIIRVV
jgi:hypothetical protein